VEVRSLSRAPCLWYNPKAIYTINQTEKVDMSLKNKEEYLQGLTDASSTLNQAQQEAIKKYGNLFVSTMNEETEAADLSQAFVALLTEYKIPTSVFMTIQSLDFAFGFVSLRN
jgi:hypothetical protein